MQRWTLAIILVLGVVLPAFLVIAVATHASIRALSRNPVAAPKIQTMMILAFVFAAAIAIVALLVLFHVFTAA